MELQRCSVCKVEKSLEEFHKNKNRQNGRTVTCKPCANKRTRLWEIENPEKVLENSRRLYHKNIEHSREKRRKRVRKWYAKNSAKAREASKSWRERNPESRRHYENKRRTLKKNNGVYEISLKETKKIASMPCSNCQKSDNITIDHILPLSRGGRHSIGNLQPLCFSCNSSKGTKTMMEWKIYLKGRD